MFARKFIIAVFLVCCASFIAARSQTVSENQTSIKIARAESAPKIDGVLSEGEWKNAVRVELTHQSDRREFERFFV
jgi:hypothetical protein